MYDELRRFRKLLRKGAVISVALETSGPLQRSYKAKCWAVDEAVGYVYVMQIMITDNAMETVRHLEWFFDDENPL